MKSTFSFISGRIRMSRSRFRSSRFTWLVTHRRIIEATFQQRIADPWFLEKSFLSGIRSAKTNFQGRHYETFMPTNLSLTSPLDGSSSIALSFGKVIFVSSAIKFCLGKVEEILWFDWLVHACFAGVDCAKIGRPGDLSSTKNGLEPVRNLGFSSRVKWSVKY